MTKTNFYQSLTIMLAIVSMISCGSTDQQNMADEPNDIFRLITLAPGHFHAALIQKEQYADLSPKVHIYAPPGPELQQHMDRINGFNQRSENPTQWESVTYQGEDYFEKMIAERKGDIVMVAGNNARKTEYILEAVKNGFHVYADKPMVITPEEYPLLQEAFQVAEEKNLILYDIMTERFEITSLLQKELSLHPEVFGEWTSGSVEEPAIVKESVHHFSKIVSGNPLVRPAWFFDTDQEGAGIVDVSTHLTDLIMWATYPEAAISQNEVEVLDANQWPTIITPSEFSKVTKTSAIPDYLQKDLDEEGNLSVYCNGDFTFRVRDIIGKVSVIWNYEAPPGSQDTHYSIMRGTKSHLIIRQGKEQNFRPTLYIEAANESVSDLGSSIESAISQLSEKYPGLSVEAMGNAWKINVPESYHIGHEAHFAQVTNRFLEYLKSGKVPEWEISNMLTKYFITTDAFRLSKENS